MSAGTELRSRQDTGLRFAPPVIYRFALAGCCETADPECAKRKPSAPSFFGKRKRRFIFAALLLLAGSLLFCHGCHGDEDNELLAGPSFDVHGRGTGMGRGLLAS
jgi:hypothetical protein